MIKVVIIGYGSIAKKHDKALRSIYPHSKIYALRSNPKAALIPNVENIFSYNEIQAIKPDFILISNATIAHEETLHQIIPFKKPLFIEKPALHQLNNAKEVLKKVSENKLKTYVACNLRFLDSIQFIKKHIDTQQRLPNEVNVYAGSYLPDWRPYTDFRKVYSANRKMGGGVHLDLIHELDYLYWIFGMPIQTHKLLRSKSSLNIDAIDYANYNLIYEGFVANVVLNYYRKDYKRTIELVFENETWVVDIANNKIISNTGNIIFESQQTILDTYTKQMQYFINLLNNHKEKSFNSLSDSIEVLKIALEHV